MAQGVERVASAALFVVKKALGGIGELSGLPTVFVSDGFGSCFVKGKITCFIYT